MSKFDMIAVAYKARLLYRSDAEYREAMGVSFETVVNNCDSKRDMAIYGDILSRKCDEMSGESLEKVVEDYVSASELYLSVNWGDRSQLASKKLMCRELFRLYATVGRELSVDEIFKFRNKDDDARLIDTFFPDGVGAEPAVDIAFIVLFAFGIIKPWGGGDKTRSRDLSDEAALQSLAGLHSLIELLQTDMPRLGSTEKPLAFTEWLRKIDFYMGDREALRDVTPLFLLSSIQDIVHACRSLVVNEQRRMTTEQFQGYDMPGIWIDDTDRGKSRFWIFPDNYLMALCFTRKAEGWQMRPFDFRVRIAADSTYSDTFIMLTPEGNLCYTLSPDSVITKEQFASGCCECQFDDEIDELNRVEMEEWPGRFPDWLDWRTWERLGRDDSRYREFREVIDDVFNSASPASLFFRNVAPELTDVVNNLVGRDGKYLYVYDWRPAGFALREKRPDRFVYESASCAAHTGDALFELPVSGDHPLYALPRHRAKELYGNAEAAQLADVLDDADSLSEIYIVHSAKISHPRLVFSAHGRTVKLDMKLLEEAGVRKFTASPFAKFPD